MPVLISSSFIVSPSTDGWAYSYSIVPEEKELIEKKGSLYGVFSDASPKTGFAESIFEKIKESYYASHDQPFVALEQSLISQKEMLGESECVVLVLCQNKLYSISYNGGKIFLFRGSSFATLLKGSLKETRSISGHLKSGDVVVMATTHFYSLINEEMLLSAVPTKTPEDLREFFIPLLRVKDEDVPYAAFFLKVSQDDEPEFVGEMPRRIVEESSDLSQKPIQRVHSLSNKPLFVKSEDKSTKRTRAFALLGILLLISFIAFGFKNKEERDKKEAFQNSLNEIQAKLDEATELAHINPTVSRELYAEAKENVLGINTENEEEVAALTKVKDTIQEFPKAVYGENIVEVHEVVDLALLSEGFSSSSISFDGSSVYIYDSTGGKVAKVSTDSNRAEIVAGPGVMKNIHHIASYVDTLYGLSDESVLSLLPNEVLLEEGIRDGFLYIYGGNIYILDKNNSEIYRYTRATVGYGPKTRWMNEGITAELGNARQWVIDGSIWVLKDDNIVYRFTNGTYWEFRPDNVLPEISTITSLYTSERDANVYILDSVSSRIVVVTKEGDLVTQYVNDELTSALFVVASEKDGKVYVITKDKLLTVTI